MKTILAAILTVLSLGTAQAVEYVTLTNNSLNRNLLATDLVEIVGYYPLDKGGRSNQVTLELTFGDDTILQSRIAGNLNNVNGSDTTIIGQKFTGITTIRLIPVVGEPHAVTFKVTSASEINAVTPSAVLVLPENSTGNYDVVIEASDDLVSWLPFFSQTVNSQTAKKFFRTRVVRSEAPVQKP